MSKFKIAFSLVVTLIASNIVAQNKTLFGTSNQDICGNTKIHTSNHFEEIVFPYNIFIKSGYPVDFISSIYRLPFNTKIVWCLENFA